MRRRKLLVAGAVVAIAGCSSDETNDDPEGEDETEDLGNGPGNENNTSPGNESDPTDDLEDGTGNESDPQNESEEGDGNGDESEGGDGEEEQPEDEEDGEEEMSEKLKQAREHIFAAESAIITAVNAYSGSGSSITDTGYTDRFDRSRIINRTLDADSELNDIDEIVGFNIGDYEDVEVSYHTLRAEVPLIQAMARRQQEFQTVIRNFSDAASKTGKRSAAESDINSGEDELEDIEERLTELPDQYAAATEWVTADELHADYAAKINEFDAVVSTLKSHPDWFDALFDILDELEDGHSEYGQGNYNSAMVIADGVRYDLEDFESELDDLEMPPGNETLHDSFEAAINANIDEARRLRNDAARAADQE